MAVMEKDIYTQPEICNNLYFDQPIQLEYQLSYDNKIKVGIGYCDEIINAIDGNIVFFNEVKYIHLLPWFPLDAVIHG